MQFLVNRFKFSKGFCQAKNSNKLPGLDKARLMISYISQLVVTF